MNATKAEQRKVELAFELSGTPEQVWHAIATGPGISSWFVPTQVEEHEGGAITFQLDPQSTSTGTVTCWQPPDRFGYEERDWAENAPPLATELIVEARAGGHCVVRLVHSLFTDSDAWDDQLSDFEAGWGPFFEVLELYLTRFNGLPCASFRALSAAEGTEVDAWQTLLQKLGLSGAGSGEHRRLLAPRALPFAGRLQRTDEGKGRRDALLLLDQPTPGIALFGVYAFGGKVHAGLSCYLFGDAAGDARALQAPAWEAWFADSPAHSAAARSVGAT